MLGLIYPAVLGTILYQLVFTVAHVLREQYPLSAIVWIKWIGTHKAYDKIDVTEVRHGN